MVWRPLPALTLLIHLFSKKSQWVKIFLFGWGPLWTVYLFLERRWSSLWNIMGMCLNQCRFSQGWLISVLWMWYLFLVFDILEMSCLSSKFFWPILWYLFREWETKVLWCLHLSTAEGLPSSGMAGVCHMLFLSHFSFMRSSAWWCSCFGSIDFWLCFLNAQPLEKVVLDPHSVPTEKESSCPEKWCFWLSFYWAFRQTFRYVRLGLLNCLEIRLLP